MNILIREVDDKKESISNFLKFLERLESNELIINDINLGEDSRYTVPIGISTVQKSSCIILLYNFIESVITNLISKIHDEIIRNNISFFDLNSDIRTTVIMYYSNVVEKMNFKNSGPKCLGSVGEASTRAAAGSRADDIEERIPCRD